MTAKISAAACALTLCLTLGACSSETNTETAEQESTATPQPIDSLMVVLVGVDSTSVFEFLVANHEVAYQSSASGNFVTAIDSVEGGGGYFWLYSVNGEMGQVAADECIVAPGDTVRWHFRKMEP